MLATAATVIPQIGSTASAADVAGGAGESPAAAGSRLRRCRGRTVAGPCLRTATIRARIESAISAATVRADRDARRHVDPPEQILVDPVGPQLVEHAGAAPVAGDEADVGDAGLEAAAQRVQLVAPVGGDDEREVAGGRLGVVAVGRGPDRGRAPRRSGSAPRRVGVSPTTTTRGAGGRRLEEDLDRPARQAGVLDRHDPLLVADLDALGTGVVRHLGGIGQDPQQHRLAALQRRAASRP